MHFSFFAATFVAALARVRKFPRSGERSVSRSGARTQCLIIFAAISLPVANVDLADWPQFRGPNSAGVATWSSPPIQFGPSKNELWRVPMASGHSSPCEVGNSIFLTTYEKTRKKLAVVCFPHSAECGYEARDA
jgi:hypothetical protein